MGLFFPITPKGEAEIRLTSRTTAPIGPWATIVIRGTI